LSVIKHAKARTGLAQERQIGGCGMRLQRGCL
jgi:hypothetical protein